MRDHTRAPAAASTMPFALCLAGGTLTALVLFPIIALVLSASSAGASQALAAISNPTAVQAITLSIGTGLLVALLQVLGGVAVAWVLVRSRSAAARWLNRCIDFPLAMPNLVAGMLIVMTYGEDTWIGQRLQLLGIEILFAKPAIVLSLMLVTFPFVVRAVEPVLRAIDPAEEEAALVLGAGPALRFRTVFLPAISPAALSAGLRVVARCLAEFGSMVVVSGNLPGRTLTGPVYIFGEIERGAPASAAAISILLILFSLMLNGASQSLAQRGRRRG